MCALFHFYKHRYALSNYIANIMEYVKHLTEKPFYQVVLLFLIYGPLYRTTHLFVSRDGRIYATVAKNFAKGLGSLDSPFYTPYWFSPFYDHPSLGIYIQSFFFKVFGEAFWIEKVYCLILYFLGVCLSYLIWDPKEKSIKTFVWCLFWWSLIPLNSHVFNNNYLEAPTLITTSFATYLLLYSSKPIVTVFAAIAVTLGFLINGPMGLYPLCVPLLLVLCRLNFPRIGFSQLLILLASFSITLLSFFWLLPELKSNFMHYYDTQIISTMTGTRGGDLSWFSHLKVIPLLFKTFLLPILLTLSAIFLEMRIDRNQTKIFLIERIKNKRFIFFILLALASSLPVGISPRLADHYFALSTPFFLIIMLYLVEPLRGTIMEKINTKLGTLLIVINLLGIVIVFITLGSPAKNKQSFQDLYQIKNYFNNHAVIGIETDLNLFDQMRDMATLLARHSNIYLDHTQQKREYVLTKKNALVDSSYKPVKLQLNQYTLWHRKV